MRNSSNTSNAIPIRKSYGLPTELKESKHKMKSNKVLMHEEWKRKKNKKKAFIHKKNNADIPQYKALLDFRKSSAA